MPSSITSGCSSETSLLKIGFSQIESPMPCPYCRAKAASSLGKPNSSAFGPDLHHVRRRRAGADQRDGGVEIVPAALVGVDLGVRGAADRERAVVARSIADIGVQDVEVRGVAGPQNPIGEDMRVRVAALARDRVDALDVLGAQVVQDLETSATHWFSLMPGFIAR